MPASRQPDLFTDWTPPEVTVRFDEQLVRAAHINAQISRVVAAALAGARESREKIAAEMTVFLGERISVNVLNAYASQARDAHTIPLHRFMALIHATRDRRLLEWIAEPMNWAVIERRHLPLIELAAVQERQRKLENAARAIRREVNSKGSLR